MVSVSFQFRVFTVVNRQVPAEKVQKAVEDMRVTELRRDDQGRQVPMPEIYRECLRYPPAWRVISNSYLKDLGHAGRDRVKKGFRVQSLEHCGKTYGASPIPSENVTHDWFAIADPRVIFVGRDEDLPPPLSGDAEGKEAFPKEGSP